MVMEHYETLLEAIEALKLQGYTEDFNLQRHCLECRVKKIQLMPDEFDIDKVFRFYGPSDPDDESILYAISSSKHNLKGLLVNGYGISADIPTQEMVEKLNE